MRRRRDQQRRWRILPLLVCAAMLMSTLASSEAFYSDWYAIYSDPVMVGEAADEPVLGTIEVEKKVELGSSVSASDINTTAYFGLWDIHEQAYVERDGKQYTIEIPIVNGVPSGTASFVDIPAGDYSVWERKKLKDGEYADLVSGVDTVNDAGAYQISVSSSHKGTAGSNQVAITTEQKVDAVTVTNTYQKVGQTRTFSANKVWSKEKNKTNGWVNDPPQDAWAEFELYENNQPTGKVIHLNGSADVNTGETAAWKAEFDHLPYYDANGKEITYSIKEINYGYTPDLNATYPYFYPIKDSVSTDSGMIVNCVNYGPLKVEKHFEIQPPLSQEQGQKRINRITFRVTGPYDYSETLTIP